MSLPTALLDDIKTNKDLQEVLNLVDQCLADLYKQKKRGAVPESFVALAKSRQVDLKDRQQAQAFFESFKKELTQIPHLGLTLALNPSEESADSIARWIHTNVSDDLILDISVDERLLGGATISFNGFYTDLSLKKTLDDAYRNDREIFTSRLKTN